MKSFTLIETISAIFVFSLLMGTISGILAFLYKTKSYQWQQSIAINEARRGIEKMIKEIREAREGENGAYPLEYAGDKELIFYSDVDQDGKTERVRYFLGEIQTQNLIKECESFQKGGFCSVSFSDFLIGNLKSAKVKISAKGDLGASSEYIDVYVDGRYLGRICQTGCSDCPSNYQGTQIFDVTLEAKDNSLNFSAKASSKVDPSCPFSFKINFELSLSFEIQTPELKRGIIEATGTPPFYPLDQEKVKIITSFVRNSPPIFEYFDENGNKILDYPARLSNTKVIKIFLVINVDPKKPPEEFQLESFVQLRNLKKE